MKITEKWLTKWNACSDGMAWYKAQSATECADIMKALIYEKRYEWGNWLITKAMNRKQRLAYVIFAAEQVIDIYEKQYPNDKRPRQAIEAAKAVLEHDTAAARAAARAAAWAAARAAARDAAWAAAWDAADAARAAARAAAWDAADAAWAAAWAAMQKKILEYGLSLLERGK